jgi:hypothetical protein
MNKAMKESTPIQGVKGPSPLIAFEHYNCVDGSCIDYMHCVLLGVLKHLLAKWLNASNKREAYYIGHFLDQIEKRLNENRPPTEITRPPINIKKFGKWKANQCRAFLIFYGYGALNGILPKVYLDHFLLLSNAIYTFLQSEISEAQFVQAENDLLRFVNAFEDLYGEAKVKYNVHSLLHIAKKVRDCGPLYCYSLFPFESKNGQLIKFIKGGRRHIQEAANKYVYYQIGKRLVS